MVQPDPDPKPAAAGDPEPVTEPEAEVADEAGDEEEAEPKPDPEKARSAVDRLMWTSTWLSVLVGVFLLTGIVQADGGWDGLAWLGTVVAILGLLALIAAYAGCALDRITLRTKVVGPADLFQVSTLVVAVVVICGLLIPTSNSAALAILLPWAVTYWLHGLTKPSTT